MNKETKKISAGLLSVIGSILFAFSIYIYVVDPSGWFVALATSVSFLVVGVVFLCIALVLWLEAKKTIV